MTENDLDTDIKFIRLNTGEDIIAQIVETKEKNDLSFLLINPLKVVYTIGNNPMYLQISMMEWVFSRLCETQEFKVNSRDILTIAKPSDHMVTYYWDTLEAFVKRKLKQTQDKLEDSISELAEIDEDEDESDSVDKIMNYLKDTGKNRKLH